MKKSCYMIFFIIILIAGCSTKESDFKYNGIPYTDKFYTKGTQTIPGKIQCEYFDIGGEGVAYHDSDSINLGSGQLNPSDGNVLNEFRMDEGVDISYTKDNGVDDSEFNLVQPEMERLYVGWTAPGEWLNYSINVKADGLFQVGIMYTSNRGGEIALFVNGKRLSRNIKIPSTYNANDSISWRQWHHWNYIDDIAQVEFEEGPQVLTLKTVSEGMMNYDYLNFEQIK